MLGRWSFRFVCWYMLVLMTQPHFRFPQLILLRPGDLTFLGAVGFHVLDCMTRNKPFLRNGFVTRYAFLLMTMILCAHYFNPHQLNTNWNTFVDGVMKISIIVILIDAQLDSIYKAVAIFGAMSLGTLWWIKGGVRLAQAGSYWASTKRLMGANVSIITNPNDFAYLTTFFLPLYYYFYFFFKWKPIKWAMLAVFFAGVFIILTTGSRTGFICLVAMVMMMAPILIKRNKSFIPISALSVFLVLPFVPQENIDRITSIGSTTKEVFADDLGAQRVDVDAESAQSRIIKIRGTWQMILANPLGVGTHTSHWYVRQWWGATGIVHNELLMAGRTMGFPGMIMYILAIVIPWRCTGKILRQTEGGQWPQVELLARIIRTQLVIVIVGGMFSPSFFHFPHMMTFVATVGVARMLPDFVSVPLAAGYATAQAPHARTRLLPA